MARTRFPFLLALPLAPPETAARNSETGDDDRRVEGREIWERAPHNAFNDLMRWHDRWFCTLPVRPAPNLHRHVARPERPRLADPVDGRSEGGDYSLCEDSQRRQSPRSGVGTVPGDTAGLTTDPAGA